MPRAIETEEGEVFRSTADQVVAQKLCRQESEGHAVTAIAEREQVTGITTMSADVRKAFMPPPTITTSAVTVPSNGG